MKIKRIMKVQLYDVWYIREASKENNIERLKINIWAIKIYLVYTKLTQMALVISDNVDSKAKIIK